MKLVHELYVYHRSCHYVHASAVSNKSMCRIMD